MGLQQATPGASSHVMADDLLEQMVEGSHHH